MSHQADNELAGAAAVVTGASSGIGEAIALELARAGADVLVHAAKSHDAAQAVAGEVRQLGRDAHVHLADFTQLTEQDRLVAAAFDWKAGLNLWVNCAGADVLTGDAAGWSFEEKLDALWRVDVVATLRLSRAAGARMKKSGRGNIINIGWDQAAHGMDGDSGELFAATKGAVMAFTRSLARSLAPEVRVNCVAPGWIRTAWGAGASDYWQDRARQESLLDRWGTPEDVAAAVRFLASPAASFINAQVLPVNGGFTRG